MTVISNNDIILNIDNTLSCINKQLQVFHSLPDVNKVLRHLSNATHMRVVLLFPSLACKPKHIKSDENLTRTFNFTSIQDFMMRLKCKKAHCKGYKGLRGCKLSSRPVRQSSSPAGGALRIFEDGDLQVLGCTKRNKLTEKKNRKR